MPKPTRFSKSWNDGQTDAPESHGPVRGVFEKMESEQSWVIREFSSVI